MFDILEALIEAKYSSKKKEYFLRKSNLNLEKLRFLARLTKDLQCMSIKSFEYAAKKIDEIGRMVGGWEKYSKTDSKPARPEGYIAKQGSM